MTFDANDLAVFLILFLAALGLGEVAGVLRRWIKPEPPPKPNRWSVRITDFKGFPIRSYRLDAEQACKLIDAIEREQGE